MMPEKIITLLGVLLVTTGAAAILSSWIWLRPNIHPWDFIAGIFALVTGILILDLQE